MVEWARLAAGCRHLKGRSWMEARIERIRFSRIAKNLAMLGLWNDRALAPLDRIANGRGQQADLREIFGPTQNMEAVTKAERPKRRTKLPYSEIPHATIEVRAIAAVAIVNQESRRRSTPGAAFQICCTVQSAVGCRVTAT